MTIPANEADSAYNLAANRISQNVNINGFRRGKAPKSVVELMVDILEPSKGRVFDIKSTSLIQSHYRNSCKNVA